jgi:hypothetical protein
VVPVPPDFQAHLALIEKPIITPITVPPPPSWVEPPFLGVQPSPPPPPPANLGDILRDGFLEGSAIMRDAIAAEIDAFIDRMFPAHRANLAAVEAKLAQYLQGGTAVNPAIEDQIYYRAQDKTNDDAAKAAKAAIKRAAQMGHTVVAATIYGEVGAIDAERRKANARVASDIAIKVFELEQQNMQFAITNCIALRKVAIDAGMAYYNGLITLNGHALQYATAIVDSIVKVYELAAKYSEIQVRIYEAEAAIYKVKLEASLAVFEVYKAQLAALEAVASINKSMVEVYRAQIDAVTAEANCYKAQIDGVTAQAELEKAKVDLYRARVAAYGEQVNADVARWRGYEALVHGQTAKIGAGAEEWKSYSVRLGAWETEIKGRTEEITSRIRVNEALISQFKAEWDGYSAAARAEGDSVQAEVASYKATVDAYSAGAHAQAEYYRATIARYSAILQGIIEDSRLIAEELRGRNQVEAAKAAAISGIANASAEVYGKTAAAAVAGMNTLAAEVLAS